MIKNTCLAESISARRFSFATKNIDKRLIYSSIWPEIIKEEKMFPTDPIQVSEAELPTKGWLPTHTRLPMVIAFVKDDKGKKKRFVANYFEECWDKTNQGDVVHRRPFGTSKLGGVKVIYFKNKKDLKKELAQ